ncbi:ABC transporter ATP-binding protein [Vreelandella profundi]|uniref:ABC transporter ATP-binding protein n=1 Tax=Vreelandella profundi TaxID=2852117 RepID=UPI001EF0C444|nr:ABC transporter ATP-binding protein [Halomonas profundi]
MIEIRNLYKRYHNHHGSDWVLKDINLTIPRGVSVGLIGPNGAGKSTLLRLIAGMDSPDRGEVIRHSRVSWPVGLSGGMQGNMTGRQNVKFVARAQGSGSPEVKRIIEFVEEFAEIGEAFDEPIRTYSSGMRSRISFGLSLAFDFDVYISDEATAVGDRSFKAKAKELFKSKVGKASLIMVSHGEGILRDLCQAGIYLKHGGAYWYDDVNEAIATYHGDVDHLSGLELTTGSLADVDVQQLTKEQLRAVREEHKRTKQYMNGLGVMAKLAQQQRWEKYEVEVLKSTHLEVRRALNGLTEVIQQSHESQVNRANAEIKKFQNSIMAYKLNIKEAENNNLDVQEKQVLEKALNEAQKQLAIAESALEELEGDD